MSSHLLRFTNKSFLELLFTRILHGTIKLKTGSILPFPNQGGILALEIILLFLLAALESLRLFFGYKGNLAERKISLIYSIFLAVPVIFCQLYLILWQTYVLRIEIVICAVALVFIGFEIILSGAMIWTFQRHESFIRQ
ncbi:transmembrane protein 216-like isoform X2 [Rhopilema esculentum]|uniref:transmembrane protein 216-like isoform X2 n=1 Tax=Rhopilema esculentum TaxID=499914 RepID=UPI0031DEADA5